MSKSTLRGWSLAIAAGCVGLAQARGIAQTWTGAAGDGSWSNPTNWNPETVPGAGDNAYINTSGTTDVTVTYDYTGAAITLGNLSGDYLGTETNGTNTLSITTAGLAITADVEYFGYNGSATINQSAGTNTDNGTLNLGSNSGSYGAYMLGGTGSLTVGNRFYLGSSGTGSFNQTGGSVSIATNYDLFMAYGAGSTGTYTLSGGTLITTGDGSLDESGNGDQLIGYSGNGTFIQSGGANTLAADAVLVLSQSVGSTGTYTLSGGTLTATGGVYVGGGTANVGAAGTGILTVKGTGSLSDSQTLTVYDTTGTSLNLQGGQITAASLDLNGTPSLLSWTAGTLEITTAVTFDPDAAGTSTSAAFGSSLTLGSGQALEIQGNETLGGTGAFSLTINSGSNNGVAGDVYLPSTGTLTQNGGIFSYARLYQQGGTINDALINLGTFDYQSGTFNGRLINQNAVDFEANFTAGNGIENDATLALPAGITVTANGQGLNNISTGVITSTPTSILQIGGTLRNSSFENTTFDLSTATVKFVGGTNHQVTWPGTDMGPTYAGYANNFAIGTLELSNGDTLTLNGPGAIYVSTLLLDGLTPSGESLSTFIANNIGNSDLDNLMNIYYDPTQTGNAYLADQTYDLGNGGVLEPVSVPEPATATAILGLAGMCGLRRRRRCAWIAGTSLPA